MEVWQKVYTDGELKALVKEGDISLEGCLKAYEDLMDSYIKEFGLSKAQKRMNSLKLHLIKLRLEYITSGDRILINQINKYEKELEKIKMLFFQQDSLKFNEFLVLLQKWYGQRIDLKTTTVLEFYSITNMYERANKKKSNSGGGGLR